MKILVIGGSGLIGSFFVKEFLNQNCDLVYTYYKNKIHSTNAVYLDVQDRLSTIKTIEQINPKLIINLFSPKCYFIIILIVINA